MDYIDLNEACPKDSLPLPRIDQIVDALVGHVLRPNDIYKFMTLLPKDYYLIPGNGAKNLFRPNYIMRSVYANFLVLPHKNFSIYAKYLSSPFFICMKRWNCSLFLK